MVSSIDPRIALPRNFFQKLVLIPFKNDRLDIHKENFLILKPYALKPVPKTWHETIRGEFSDNSTIGSRLYGRYARYERLRSVVCNLLQYCRTKTKIYYPRAVNNNIVKDSADLYYRTLSIPMGKWTNTEK